MSMRTSGGRGRRAGCSAQRRWLWQGRGCAAPRRQRRRPRSVSGPVYLHTCTAAPAGRRCPARPRSASVRSPRSRRGAPLGLWLWCHNPCCCLGTRVDVPACLPRAPWACPPTPSCRRLCSADGPALLQLLQAQRAAAPRGQLQRAFDGRGAGARAGGPGARARVPPLGHRRRREGRLCVRCVVAGCAVPPPEPKNLNHRPTHTPLPLHRPASRSGSRCPSTARHGRRPRRACSPRSTRARGGAMRGAAWCSQTTRSSGPT